MDRPLGSSRQALLLAGGIALAGYFVGQTLYNAKVALNTAEAKGLAERRVEADRADWTIGFKVSGKTRDDIPALYAEGERHQQTIVELLEAGVRNFPNSDGIHGSLGIVYAALGREEDAIREGKLAVELLDGSQRDSLGYRLRDLAEIYLRVGDTKQAIEQLDRLLSIPSFFSAAFLALDPTWRALHDDPQFQAMLKTHGA